MQLQNPSPQRTVMIFSFLETDIYYFKIRVFGVLVHSDFSKKYSVFKKKKKVCWEQLFQTSNISQNTSYLLTFTVSYKARFWFPELKGGGMNLMGGNVKFQRVLIC